MSRHHRRYENYPYPYGVVPQYALLPERMAESGCGCSGSSAAGALGSVETWVKTNPLPALLAAFAVGWLVMGKKRGF